MATSTEAEQAKEEMEKARVEVMESEREIQTIKMALRQVASEGEQNSLKISAIKVVGLPEAAVPTFKLQLSSPIEELELTKLFDPLDPEAEGSVVTFSGVEPSVAMLTVSAKDANVDLGSSANHDVAPLCEIVDAKNPSPKATELEVAIVTPEDLVGGVPNIGPQGGNDNDDEESVPTDQEDGYTSAVEEEVQGVVIPICTVTLRIEYVPSPKDIKEELYDVLNQASKKKAAAIDKLRKSAAALSRAAPAAPPTSDPETTVTRAVKSGFLNKPKKKQSFFSVLYERTVGPSSVLMTVGPKAKNYIIFFGAVVFFQFKGDVLALPPPV
eukprot:scaffold10372_cov44-Attheya_sp.AAC.1